PTAPSPKSKATWLAESPSFSVFNTPKSRPPRRRWRWPRPETETPKPADGPRPAAAAARVAHGRRRRGSRVVRNRVCRRYREEVGRDSRGRFRHFDRCGSDATKPYLRGDRPWTLCQRRRRGDVEAAFARPGRTLRRRARHRAWTVRGALR